MNLLDATNRVTHASLLRHLRLLAQRAGLEAASDAGGRASTPHAALSFAALPEAADCPTSSCLPSESDSVKTLFEGQELLRRIFETADAAAAGFSHASPTNTRTKPSRREDVITVRLRSLLEEVRLDRREREAGALHYRKPLVPLSASSIFPQKETSLLRRDEAEREYKRLFDAFSRAGEAIAPELKSSGSLWLDAFDTLWLTFGHAVPALTEGDAEPDVSLYDHSRTSAALAAALWRWGLDRIEAGEETRESFAASFDDRTIREKESLLFIQGDFFGIQNFIFSGHEKTNGKMAKILRGRSFYVSLLTEACSLRILEALDLPSTAQLTNAAGKFLIVAPDTPKTRKTLEALRPEIDEWFIRHTCAEAGIGIVWQSARLSDLAADRLPALMTKLVRTLERAKLQRFNLCAGTSVPEVLPVDYPEGVCAWQGRWPADRKTDGLSSCAVSRDQIRVGEALPRTSLLLLLRYEQRGALSDGCESLELPLFGYQVVFAGRSQFSSLVRERGVDVVRRAWDFSVPHTADEVLWKGFARRSINRYVPRFAKGEENLNPVYEGLDAEDVGPQRIKPFSWLSREDLVLEEDGTIRGVDALAHLKGDVDQLGRIFQEGLADPVRTGSGGSTRRRLTFAKTAQLSREMNTFFSVYVPFLCRSEHPSIYTVFAGGDDFSFIGPRRKTQEFAEVLRERFEDFAAHNPEVHFSAGLTVAKPGIPVRALSDAAEAALEAAKASGRNAVTIYGLTFPWTKWEELRHIEEKLEHLREHWGLSTSYLYSLFELLELAGRRDDPQSSIWRSRLCYRTARFARDACRNNDGDVARLTESLLSVIGAGIESEGERFRVPLTNLFYRIRVYRK